MADGRTAAADGATVRRAFLDAADGAVALLAEEAVAAAWDRPSVLAEWSVGGLAAHLGRGVLTVAGYLDAEAAGAPESAAADRALVDGPGYLLAALGDEDLAVDSATARAIRQRGTDAAADGPAAVHAEVAAALAELRPRLDGPDALPGDHRLLVLDGIAIALDDYLTTRVVELVLHADDLAASTDLVVAPRAAATAVAVGVVVEVARRRRGDLVVLRALARRERVPPGPIAL